MARTRKTQPAEMPSPLDPEQQLLQQFLSIARLPPEEAAPILERIKNDLTQEQKDQIAASLLRSLKPYQAREFTLDGCCAYYELVHGFPPPEHVRREFEVIFQAKEEEKGQLIIASRGTWKTTSIALTFAPWFIGHHPTTANLIIQAGESSAASTSLYISDHIRYHPAFAAVFPHVVPNFEKKWATDGYEVIQTHTDASKTIPLSQGEWAKMNAARKDPTLLAVSYNSKAIVGKHPDGLFLIDDLHDEENTKSEAMLQDVISKLKEM